MFIRLSFLIGALLLSGCATIDHNRIAELLNDPGRSAADRTRDASSRPMDVLRFFGIERGDTVLDLFSGTAYYSEIAAAAVGPEGRVYAHNNAAYLEFAGDGLETRLAASRADNLVRYDREVDALDLADDSVDLVLMILTYHDIYYVTDGWRLDGAQLFAQLKRVLKPGGVLGIVDHHAIAGRGMQDAQTLHRIDAEYAKRDIASHGFRLSRASRMLENPQDDLNVLVFDPAVRGKTSRFVYRFVLDSKSE
jgi:predicted methyltransferase